MRVLIIGSGGREHAFAHAMRQSPKLSALFVAPGNAGILEIAERAAVDVTDHSAVADFCAQQQIDLVIVGPKHRWLTVWRIACARKELRFWGHRKRRQRWKVQRTS